MIRTGAELHAWKDRAGLTWRGAAAALGVALSNFQRYCKMDRLPRWLVLATSYLEEHPEAAREEAPKINRT